MVLRLEILGFIPVRWSVGIRSRQINLFDMNRYERLSKLDTVVDKVEGTLRG